MDGTQFLWFLWITAKIDPTQIYINTVSAVYMFWTSRHIFRLPKVTGMTKPGSWLEKQDSWNRGIQKYKCAFIKV